MQELNRQMMTLPELRELEEIIRFGTGPAAVSGVSGVHRAMLGAALRQETKRPLAVLCADEQEARRMAADLAALTGEECVTLFAREWQLRDRVSASHSFEQERLDALCRMAFGRTGIVVATVDGMMQRTLPPTALRDAVLTLRLGEEHDLRALAERLTAAGYVRCEQVEGAGQFAVRGGILDVYSPMSAPVRVEFFDTEIDAMGEFDVATQRRTKNLEELTVLPAAEVLPFAAEGGRDAMLARMEHAAAQLAKKVTTEKTAAAIRADMDRLREGLPLGGMDRYLAAAYPTAVCAADYLPEGSIVLVCEGSRVMERAKGCAFEWSEDLKILLEEGVLAGQFASLAVELEDLTRRLRGSFPLLLCDSLPTSRYLALPRAMLSINARQLPSYGGSLETAAADMEHYLAAGSGVLVLCGNETRAKNFHRLLEERGVRARLDLSDQMLPAAGETVIGLGALSAGCEYPQLRLVILTEGQLLAPVSGKAPRAVRQKKDSSRQKLRSYTDLTPGDLVVHQRHGIGRFVGMERIRVDGADKDYIKIAYAGSDSLYVPATQLDMVSKYIGSHGGGEEGEHVKLNKLGGTDWTKAKSRAKAAAKDLAKGLIKLYAERQRRPGFAFSPDSTWQREFEDAFDYEETDDQLRAIAEIKSDMERSRPMDRLLCGDVGYGKTEVALRAVMKCVLDGKQAAILVPTTVLAQQHYATAINRFRSFPVTIEVLSRFKTPAQKKKILQSAAEGKIDLLIGTHSLLQKGLHFKDLGLLVIDEEQRFGVTHKEKLKELSKQVDTLTLSATPIPRTLNMALSGIRDMSTIEMPPQDRQPVQTYVLEHDWGVIAEAIRRELSRGGQVYYLHNRVETIDRCAAQLKKLLGEEVSIAVAHGKLDEKGLSHVMQQFSDGEAQILVCTTIIETGIDIPNVNTLIIEDADRLGLAQLHQIRGRIGRSARRAYAYMTYRPGKILTEAAAKRLTAIREYAEFGSGFRIAMRDLEIRGAGNLLGPEQSGYMMSVGYDMYLQLLEEAVLEERGEKKASRTDCSADLTVSANLPESYIPSPEQRMDIYRRIAVAHGKLDEKGLSHVMQQFSDGEAQILVCTTIIETGIDIPNVNTLVIEDADRLGLAQLHQIRGRIGRSARRAYAYMTYRPGKILTEVAAKRLTAIREYAEFGSGFRIAMRDLEIRGAGNLLGPEQSGYMMSVGYDMYLQLLEEAVLEERGEKKASRTDCSADLTVSANLPESYIPSPEQRMDIYRRIAAVRTREESQDLLDELLDRYGEPPASTLALLDVAMLRGEACAAGIRDISQRGDTITFTFGGEMPVEAVMRVCAMGKNKRRLTLSAGIEPKLALRLEGGEKPLPAALELVESIAPAEGA